MKLFAQFEKSEKRILIGSTIGAIICLFLLFLSDDYYSARVAGSNAEIGQIIFKVNDIRLKSSHSYIWEQSGATQVIRSGDAIFAGENSRAQIELHKGGELTLGANSLVSFREVDQLKLADLTSGNFNVKVNGTVRVAVNGVVTELKGKNSEVQIVVAKNKRPQVRLLKGTAEIQRRAQAPVVLDKAVVTQLAEPPPSLRTEPVTEPITESIEPAEIPQALKVSSDLHYIWHLHDLYTQNGALLSDRSERPASVSAQVLLEWQASKDGKPSTLELAADSSFNNSSQHETLTNSFETRQLALGQNFWRVSFDGADWSPVQQFTLIARFLESAPSAHPRDAKIPLVGEKTMLPLKLESAIETMGFIVQASTDPNFSTADSRLYWYNSPDFNISFYKPGMYYYRFRAVSRAQELSEWSKVVPISVFVPDLPPPPRLLQAKREGFVGEQFPLRWQSQGVRTEVELTDELGQLIGRQPGEKMVWAPDQPGVVIARAYTIDQYGRTSAPSKPARLVARARPVPLVVKQDPPAEITREPAALTPATTVNKVELPAAFFNDKYKNSTYSFQGFLMTMQSSEQYYQQQQSPISAGLGVKIMRWFEHHGFEAMMKMKLAGANGTGRDSSLKDLEARYHYRITTGFPFGLAREFQISAFGGAEVYRNSGSLFVGKYEMLKFGTLMEFPWAQNWRMGGEFVYGRGFEGSQKFEISGHMNYFYSRDWSFGVGYKIHLFQAGSVGASPSGYLPFREGYTEGFSVLDYYY